MHNNLLAIVGTTASGKTELSLALAQELKAEIISCDSMQVYKYMDVGTAKATPQEQALVTHHMLDVKLPHENYTVVEYHKEVKKLISLINERDRLPMLVGGTGLYYQAVVDDYQFYPPAATEKIHNKLGNIYKQEGLTPLVKKLALVDPNFTDTKNPRRVIRALEVYELTGNSYSSLQAKNQSPYRLAVLGLYLEREQLNKKIDARVEQMWQAGILDEIKTILSLGAAANNTALQAIGYREGAAYLSGLLTENEAIREMKRETRRLAKHQQTWFKRDHRIHWLDGSLPANQLVQLSLDYLHHLRFP